jgi:hypothetical protein
MNEEQDDLKKQHGYDSWRGRNSLDENLFVWNFFLSGNELSGWQPHRIQRIEARESDSPFLLRSIWKQPESSAKEEKLLSIDTLECASRAAAHEALLQMLGEFQGPIVTRSEQSEVGDVAFTAPGGSLILFARANLVIMVRNAGRDLVAVGGVASQLDADLIKKTELMGGRVTQVQQLEPRTEGYKLGERVPLGVVTTERLGHSQWFKLFSSPGEIVLEKGALVYEYKEAGPQKITVIAINPAQEDLNRELFRKQ